MTDFNSMLADLVEFCRGNGVEVNSITMQNCRNECELCLTWYKKGHDGSKCKKLCIPGFEDVPEQLDKLTLKKQKKVEVPDEDGEVPVKAKEIKVGDTLIYYGCDKTKHGQECKVAEVKNGGYYITIEFADKSTYNKVAPKDLRRKVNGA